MDWRLRDVNVGLQGWKTFCAQASEHHLLQTQGGLFCLLTAFVCVVLCEFWLRLNEIHEVRTFSPCIKPFFCFCFCCCCCFLVTWKLLWIQSNQCQSKKMIIPSVWNGIKRFEHFQRGLYFSDNCAFDLWVDFVSSASHSFAGLN